MDKKAHNESCFINCLLYQVRKIGIMDTLSCEEFHSFIHIITGTIEGQNITPPVIQSLAEYFNITIAVYSIENKKNCTEYAYFVLTETNKELKEQIEEMGLKAFNKKNYYARQKLNENNYEADLTLLCINNHYDVLKNPEAIVNKVLCKRCRHWIRYKSDFNHWFKCELCPKCGRNTTQNSEHIRHCSGTMKTTTAQIIQNSHNKIQVTEVQESIKKQKIEPVQKIKEYPPIRVHKITKEDMTWKANVHFADFETFANEDDPEHEYKVHAAGVISIMDPPENQINKDSSAYAWEKLGSHFWGEREPWPTRYLNVGKKAMRRFMDRLKALEGVVYFWNGAGFDLFFVLKYMLKNNWELNEKSVIIHNNRIMSMKIHPKLVARDLMLLMMPCSLKNACKSYGVPSKYSKGEFDHTLIKTWKDVYKYEEEILEYLENDVISMLIIYENYAQAVYDNYGANITNSITLSHLAYSIWSSMFKEAFPNTQMYNLPIDYYRRLIPSYYGGRVLLTRAQWTVKNFQNLNSEEDYNSLQQYKKKVDVVSLYPSVMAENYYPVGRFYLYEDKDMDRFIPMIKDVQNVFWHVRTFVCVDVTCPRDIYVPFLMSRSETGELIQDLNDKVKQVYYVPELHHAVATLGYKVTKVHWVVEFEDAKPVFKPYIRKFWTEKKASTKGTARYETAKGMGNSLSGKMGQEVRTFNVKVRKPGPIDEDTEADQFPIKFVSAEPIIENDKVLGYITQEPTDEEETQYPSYLSIAILAYSRIAMSKFTHIINGYFDPEETPLYGDTDSLIVSQKGYELLKPYIGKELGQLDDELQGGKIVAFTGLALKTYNHVHIAPDGTLWDTTRCKGIPHKNISRRFEDIYKEDKVMKMTYDYLKKYLEEPNVGQPIPIHNLGTEGIVYVFKEKGGDSLMAPWLSHDFFRKVLLKQGIITAYYLAIQKTIKPTSSRAAISVRYNLCSRGFAKTDWWSEEKRRLKPKSVDDISEPIGFINESHVITQ
jgi:hypothetical protein